MQVEDLLQFFRLTYIASPSSLEFPITSVQKHEGRSFQSGLVT